MKQNTILLASLIVLAAALAGAGVWVYQTQIAPKPVPAAQSSQESRELSPALEEIEPERESQIEIEGLASTMPGTAETETDITTINSGVCYEFFDKSENELRTIKLPDYCGKTINLVSGMKLRYVVKDYDWRREVDPYVGAVVALWDENGDFLQKITETLNNAWSFSEDSVDFSDDVNFDGYKDLKVLVNSGPGTGFTAEFYSYWIFNPITKNFIKDSVLTKIVNPDFQLDRKLIISSIGVGTRCFIDPDCIGGVETIYKFSNGSWQFAYNAANLPKFEDFPVQEIYSGQPADVDFTNHPGLKNFDEIGGAGGGYKQLITDEVAKGPNFAGHYRIIDWGCGTSCRTAAIIDVASGEIIYSPLIDDSQNWTTNRPDFSPWENLDYQMGSALLIVNNKYYHWTRYTPDDIFVEGL